MNTIELDKNLIQKPRFFQTAKSKKVNIINKRDDQEGYELSEVMKGDDGEIQYSTRGLVAFYEDSFTVNTVSYTLVIPFAELSFFDKDAREDEFNELASLPSTF